MSLPRYEHLVGGDTPVVRAYGVTHQELFEHAVLGSFALVWPVASIPPRYSRPLVAPGGSLEELLVNWIEEAIDVARREELAVSYVVVDRLEPGGVQGSVSGLPAAEVERVGAVIRGVAEPHPELVTIPDGFWADVTLDREMPLRLA